MKKNICMILFIIVTVLFIFPINSRAESLTDIINNSDDFLNSNKEDEVQLFDKVKAEDSVNQLYYIALTIGIVLTVIVGMIIGIKLITSGVEGQAKIKEQLIPFAVGAFVIFGAFGIWRLVLNMMQSTFN